MTEGQGFLILIYRCKTEALKEDAACEDCLAREKLSPSLWALIQTFFPQSYYNHFYTAINKSERHQNNQSNAEGKLSLITSRLFYTIKNPSRYSFSVNTY